MVGRGVNKAVLYYLHNALHGMYKGTIEDRYINYSIYLTIHLVVHTTNKARACEINQRYSYGYLISHTESSNGFKIITSSMLFT